MHLYDKNIEMLATKYEWGYFILDETRHCGLDVLDPSATPESTFVCQQILILVVVCINNTIKQHQWCFNRVLDLLVVSISNNMFLMLL